MKPLETLRKLGEGAEPGADVKARVYGALMAGMQAAPPGSANPAAASPVAPTHPAGMRAVVGAKLWAFGVGLTLMGGALGAAIYGAMRPPAVRVVYVDRPVPVLAAPPAASVGVSAPVTTSAGPPTVATAKPLGSAKSDSGSGLARERALLDQARKSAASGDAAQTLSVVELHRAEFPAGQLVEEREALAIQALAKLGRTEEASARAQAFRARYPESFLTDVVDAIVAKP